MKYTCANSPEIGFVPRKPIPSVLKDQDNSVSHHSICSNMNCFSDFFSFEIDDHSAVIVTKCY